MFNASQSPNNRLGQIGRWLVWAGVMLLTVGAAFAGQFLFPYISSRLYPLSPSQSNASEVIPPAADQPAADDLPTTSDNTLLPVFSRPASGLVEVEPTSLPSAASFTTTPTPRPVTRILIASIGVNATVVSSGWEMTTVDGSDQPVWSVPDAQYAGWHEGSVGLGVPGNTVISGHNWPQDAVFRDLYRIQPEERIILYSGSTPFVYEVTDVLLLREAGQPLAVRQENARFIQPTNDERLTLVTCHPYGSVENRLVVIARPASPTQPGVGEE